MFKIAFISPVDPKQDIKHFSGITYHLFQALEKYAEVIPVVVQDPPSLAFNYYKSIGSRLTRILSIKYKWELHPWLLRELSQTAQKLVSTLNVDHAIVIGQAFVTDWRLSVPVSFFSDTIYGAKTIFYWGSTSRLQLAEFKTLNRLSIASSSKIFLTSDFAFRRSAKITGVEVPPSKRTVTLVGANLGKMELKPFSVREYTSVLHAIWVGRDWIRKGGDDAIRTVGILIERGLKIVLHIVGAEPKVAEYEWLVYEGFLNKDDEAQLAKFQRLMEESHFFILPTLIDLTPCVLAEASAFGQVVVTRAVGGIPEMFPDNSAVLIDMNENFPGAAAERIARIIQEDTLDDYSRASRLRYQDYLNWDVIAQKIIKEINQE